MKKWNKSDLIQAGNILVALKKAKYEVQGEEILAFGQAVRWISILHDEIANDLKPNPVEVLAKNQSPVKEAKKKKK